MAQYYTYILKSSTDGQPFYIGKGSNTRMYQHKEEALREGYSRRSVHCKIISLLNQGAEIIYEKIDQPDEEAAFGLEKNLIAKYGRKDLGTGILCNLTDGGEGQNRSRESIERTAAKHRGMKRSDESKQRMKKAQLNLARQNLKQYGYKKNPESEAKRVAQRVGIAWSENARAVIRNKPTAIPVLVYRKGTNEFVGEYESMALTARTLNVDLASVWKILTGHMSKALDGKMRPYRSHRGYTFKYKD